MDDEGNSVTKTKTLTIKGSTSYDCFSIDYLNFYVKEDGTLVFSNEYSNIKLQLFTMEGRLVFNEYISTNNKKYRLKKRYLSEGMYTIRVQNDDEVKMKKMIF